MTEVEQQLAHQLQRGQDVVLATVIRLDGEPPSTPGAKVLLSQGSLLAGTLGCAEFDAQALDSAGGLLDQGRPAIRTYQHDLGSIEVFLEPYVGQPMLVVVSATPVAACLVPWAAEAGFSTVLLESRSERLLGWETGNVVASVSELEAPLPKQMYVVCTDHDAPGLVEQLSALLQRGPRYVGVMGSRRHTGHHLDALRARGMPESAVSRVQSPVGLDIGAQTPAEIAVSILAGVIAARRGRAGGWLDPEAR